MGDILVYRGPPGPSVAQHEHLRATRHRPEPAESLGEALALMLQGWADYAAAHQRRYENGIGEDYVLGPEWVAIGRALRGLLNGDLGGLDAGSLDANIRAQLKTEGEDAA